MDRGTLGEALKGVVAVAITPFSQDGRVMAQPLADLTRRLDDAGIHAITALGNTAEPFQLSGSEREEVLRVIAEHRRKAVLIAGVPGPRDDAERVIDKAMDFGYDAVMLHEPVDPLASEPGIVDYLLGLCESSPLPVILYCRSRLSFDSIASLAALDSVAAIKLAESSIPKVSRLLLDLESRANCQWVCGTAETYVPLFAAHGVTGFTSGLCNVAPEAVLSFWEAIRSGREAFVRDVYPIIAAFESLRISHNGRHNIAVIKAAMALCGHDVGDVRAPCESIGELEHDLLKQVLSRLLPQVTMGASTV